MVRNINLAHQTFKGYWKGVSSHRESDLISLLVRSQTEITTDATSKTESLPSYIFVCLFFFSLMLKAFSRNLKNCAYAYVKLHSLLLVFFLRHTSKQKRNKQDL